MDPLLESNVPSSRWQMQWQWWVNQRKTFRLIDLPSEIRDTIYGHCFGEYINPFPRSKARKLGSRAGAFKAAQPGLGLLRASKKVSGEALEIFYLCMPFLIRHYGLITPLVGTNFP
jgi:hypothetical protein